MLGIEPLWQAILAWWGLPLDERIWECGKTAAALLGSWEFLKYLYRWIFRRRSRLEQRVERLEEEARWKDEEIRSLRSEKVELSAELETAKRGLPETAIARAEHEWHYNNKVRAIRELESWFEANAKRISDIAVHLAEYHISRAVPDPGDHLDRARNMLRLARGASPDSQQIRELSSELDVVNAGIQEQLIRDGDAHIAWNSAMAPRPGTPGEGLIPMVNALGGIARYCLSKGLWRLAPIFGDRAADLALSGGPTLNRLWCMAEASAGHYQIVAGHHLDGLRRIDHALALARASLPVDDEVILVAGFYRSDGLGEVGRYGEGLDEIETLLSAFTKIKGTRQPYILLLRLQRGYMLNNLGRYVEALDDIDAVAPIQAEELGARHPDVLTTRYHRALVLAALGRAGEVLDEIDALIPIHAEVKGERHPDVLATRRLRAYALRLLGRYGEAFDEVDAVVRTATEVIGAENPGVLMARALRAELLKDLGRNEEALTEIDDLLPVAEMMIARRADLLTIRVSRAIALRNLGRYNEAIDDFHAIAPLLTQLLGPRAPATLAIHMLYAQALHGLGRYEQALREIDTFGPMQADVIGELHHDVLTNRLVRAMALKGLGRSDEARTEVLETIARLNRATDPTGGLLRAANLLLGNEERQPSAIPARSES